MVSTVIQTPAAGRTPAVFPRLYWLLPVAIVACGALVAAWAAGTSAARPDWASWTTLTPAARSALANLRQVGDFRWYVVTLLVVVLYIYSVEIEHRRWGHVFAGLAVFGMDWFNELWNGLVLHFTRTSAMWVTPGHSALVLLPGWNIEIAFMFAIAGVVFARMLHPVRHTRLLAVPNRWFWAIGLSILAVFVEVLLNRAGELVWYWSFWNWPNVPLIFIFGYLHFFVVAFIVYDLATVARKALVVSTIFAVDLAATLVFVVGLGWM